MSELTVQGVACDDVPQARVDYTVTHNELAWLSALAKPDGDAEGRGTLTGISAARALLLHELLGCTQKAEQHLGVIASVVAESCTGTSFFSSGAATDVVSAAASPPAVTAPAAPVVRPTWSATVTLPDDTIAKLGLSLANAVTTAIQPLLANQQAELELQRKELNELREALRECRDHYTKLTVNYETIHANFEVIREAVGVRPRQPQVFAAKSGRAR
jgi:hypothetical protein